VSVPKRNSIILLACKADHFQGLFSTATTPPSSDMVTFLGKDGISPATEVEPQFQFSATNSWKVSRRSVICCEARNPSQISSLHLAEEQSNPSCAGYTTIKLTITPWRRANDGDLGCICRSCWSTPGKVLQVVEGCPDVGRPVTDI
jgi:hypothetical protein